MEEDTMQLSKGTQESLENAARLVKAETLPVREVFEWVYRLGYAEGLIAACRADLQERETLQ